MTSGAAVAGRRNSGRRREDSLDPPGEPGPRGPPWTRRGQPASLGNPGVSDGAGEMLNSGAVFVMSRDLLQLKITGIFLSSWPSAQGESCGSRGERSGVTERALRPGSQTGRGVRRARESDGRGRADGSLPAPRHRLGPGHALPAGGPGIQRPGLISFRMVPSTFS